LEHIPNDTKAMQELYRVLKPGGKALLQVPLNTALEETFEDDSIVDKATRTKVFGQYDHVRVYGKDYFEKLRQTGFEVNEIQYGKSLTESERVRFAVTKDEYIPLCLRPTLDHT
jgi:ubiquinone/menaquinone biosynthesis C-methylase UbiE